MESILTTSIKAPFEDVAPVLISRRFHERLVSEQAAAARLVTFDQGAGKTVAVIACQFALNSPKVLTRVGLPHAYKEAWIWLENPLGTDLVGDVEVKAVGGIFDSKTARGRVILSGGPGFCTLELYADLTLPRKFLSPALDIARDEFNRRMDLAILMLGETERD